MAVTLWPLVTPRMGPGARAVTVIYGPCWGGLITNPGSAKDQGLAVVEPLYIDLVNPERVANGEGAVIAETATCFKLQPGQNFAVPFGFDGQVSVNAASTGHAFSGYVVQPADGFQGPETLPGGKGEVGLPFPPAELSVLSRHLPAYLYQQYSDDDDLQAWVGAFNTMVHWYIQWFANLNPADYTQSHISGVGLDWVAAGLYGMWRPALPLGFFRTVGPFNTWALNTWQLDAYRIIPPDDYQTATDDIFRRILTWHLYKDDGDVFNIRWLKRRVERFLTGTDGTGGASHGTPPWWAPDQTYDVSVTFGPANEVDINFIRSRRTFRGGALFNAFGFNTTYLNEFNSDSFTVPVSPLAPIFKSAADSGALELPFQYRFVVNIAN